MARINKIRGLQTVLQNMRRQDMRLRGGLERGLKKAGLYLQAKSQKEVPVEFGVLRASAFTRAEGKGLGTRIIVGYTAAYAIYVHENLDAAHGRAFNAKYAADIEAGIKKSRGEGQKAKFLEDPYKNRANQAAMRFILRGEMAR